MRSARAMNGVRGYWIGTVGLFALALAVYLWQASHTGLLNPSLAERDRYLATVAERATIDLAAEEAAARLYWQRYPDVSGDSYYGRDGPLGLLGARQHYRDHGRREGRRWGP